MKAAGRRKCLHCGEFYQPDRRNRRHQRYCAKPDCRKRSKAESQRRWLQRPENQSYFRGPENCQRVKAWRQRHPGCRRKKKAQAPAGLQEVFPTQAPEAQGVSSCPGHDGLQDLFSMQPAMVSGTYLHDDRQRVTRRHRARPPGCCYAKAKTSWPCIPPLQALRPRPPDDHQTPPLSRRAPAGAAPV
jgi:hypothetical protein